MESLYREPIAPVLRKDQSLLRSRNINKNRGGWYSLLKRRKKAFSPKNEVLKSWVEICPSDWIFTTIL